MKNKMILVLGANSFNVKVFLNSTERNVYCLVHKEIPKIDRNNIFFINKISEVKNLNQIDEITIINFASSYNSRKNIISLISSNFLKLFMEVVKSNRIDTVNIINIGSYWQNSDSSFRKPYTIVKNFSDYVFIKLYKSVNYINLKIGDVIDIDDERDKLVKYLIDNENSDEIFLKSSEDELLFPISRKNISDALDFLIENSNLLRSSEIYYVSLFKSSITLKNFIDEFKLNNNLEYSVIFKGRSIKRRYNFEKNNNFCLIV